MAVKLQLNVWIYLLRLGERQDANKESHLGPIPASFSVTLRWLAGRSISRSTQAYLKHGLDIWSQETTASPIIHH